MASKEPLKQQVPRETLPHVSQSVITSSNINQGDLVDTVSSSSSTNAPTAPKASAIALKSPSPKMAHSIPNPTNATFYASINDINSSSNAKTYVGGSINSKIAIIAGNTKSIEIDVDDEDEQDCAPYITNKNNPINAIHPTSLKIKKQLVEQCNGSKPVYNTQNLGLYQYGPASNKGWGIPKGMGLRGGGENSLNAGTSGWGTPPAAGGSGWGAAAPNPAAQSQWGGNRPPGPTPNPNPNAAGAEFNGQNKPGAPAGVSAPNAAPTANPPVGTSTGNGGTTPTGQSPAAAAGPAAAPGNTSWAQAAGKGLPQGPSPAQTSTTKQIEQLNSMREALFSQDGWGGQNVNQDTSWDTPGSPEPSKGDPANGTGPLWKQNINNGTDLWEANLRNGGQPPAQQPNKTPWGHTPTTNIGGTWGEDDENNDAGNVWTGTPGGAPGGAPGAQTAWPGNPSGPWPEKKPEWGAGPGGVAAAGNVNQWGGGGNAGAGGAGNNGGAGGGGGGGGNGPPIDPRDPRAGDPNNRDILPMNEMGLMRMRNEGGVMRGDPRGVSGRLNNTDQMWAAHQPPPTPKLGGLPPAGNQWSSALPKDIGGMVNAQGKPSGWGDEPSPPAQRRNIPNYDDGTSLWGQQPQTRLPQPTPVAPNKSLGHWDKLPGNNMGRGSMPCPTGMPGTRMPSAGAVKPDGAPVWGQGRNGSWDHDNSEFPGWAEDNSKLTSNWPNDSPLTPPSWPGGKPGANKPGWGDDSIDAPWAQPSMQRQKLTPEFIHGSKQFRQLSDMNFKKEDIEIALRSSNMSFQDAAEMLGNWNRRSEDHSFEQSMLRGSGFNPVQPCYPGGPGNANNPLTVNKMNLMAHAQLGGQGGGQGGLVANQNRAGGPQPSAQQLKMLIHQIQTAVSTGYLNHQILNQPLAPPTLMLVNHLLQHIKNLQQLTQKNNLLNSGAAGMKNNNQALQAQLQLQITKTKQNIQNFQAQIAAHQANYIKQQPQQPLQMAQCSDSSDPFKSTFSEPLSQIANFPDLSISDKTSMSYLTQSQSRLNQWIKYGKEMDKDVESEFSRAPGSAKGQSSNLSETWSVSGRSSDGGWPDTGSSDLTDKESQWSTQQTNSIADFIPEFEPGKPWKGTQMKSVEEDPSITPGSVAHSMASIKDSDLLSESNKASPGPQGSASGQDGSVLTSLGLSSSPWNSGTSSVYTSPISSKLSSSKSWGESTPASQSADLWLSNKARGPPPGLGAKIGHTQPNWSGAGSRSSWGTSPSSWGSSWLILRNLTPQIDGSTLKTLCMQHGPLQSFHLHLNVATALAKYSSRDEANKAQQALNNCVLGNTTIFAESPGESEVATLLSQLGHSNAPNNQTQTNWNRSTSQPQTTKISDTWATSAGSLPGYAGSGNLWQTTSSSNSLWGSDGDAHRSTPSGTSLNSFLPPDLLNGETM